MFIKLQEHIIAVRSIQAIYPRTDTVGKGKPEDERAWYIVVECTTGREFTIPYDSRANRDKILKYVWMVLSEAKGE